MFLDANKEGIRAPVTVRPVEEQNEYESRRAWKAVADGIRKGDFDAASVAKTALEVRFSFPPSSSSSRYSDLTLMVVVQNAERQRRKDEAAASSPFKLRLCTKLVNDPEYKRLASMIKFKVRPSLSPFFSNGHY